MRDRFGLTGPGAWILAVVVSLGAVRSAAAEDAAKAEAQRLKAELKNAKEDVVILEKQIKKLCAELKDAQLKNALDVDVEVSRLRDLLRTPDKEAEEIKRLRDLLRMPENESKARIAALEAENKKLRNELGDEKRDRAASTAELQDRCDDLALSVKKVQAENLRNALRDELSKKTADEEP